MIPTRLSFKSASFLPPLEHCPPPNPGGVSASFCTDSFPYCHTFKARIFHCCCYKIIHLQLTPMTGGSSSSTVKNNTLIDLPRSEDRRSFKGYCSSTPPCRHQTVSAIRRTCCSSSGYLCFKDGCVHVLDREEGRETGSSPTMENSC